MGFFVHVAKKSIVTSNKLKDVSPSGMEFNYTSPFSDQVVLSISHPKIFLEVAIELPICVRCEPKG